MNTKSTFNNQTTLPPYDNFQRIFIDHFQQNQDTSKVCISYSSIVKGDA